MAFKMKSSLKKLTEDLTTPSDTIQGISMDQNTAKLKFERNLKRKGINPFSPTVKQNTDILKNSEGNFIYRYITPSKEK